MKNKLNKQLFSLNRKDGVKIQWCKCPTVKGSNSNQDNYRHLATSRVIVLLVSPDFMNLNDGWEISRKSMVLYNTGKARVIPVKLSSIDNWEATPFRDLQYLPINGEPVTGSRVWINQDEAFQEVARGIREVVEEVEQEQQRQIARTGVQDAILASISSLVSNQLLARVSRDISRYPRSFPVAAGILVVATPWMFYNFVLKNQVENLFNQREEKNGFVGAVEDYRQGLQIASNDINEYFKRGNAHYDVKDFQAAIDDYTQVISLKPSSGDATNAYFKRGNAYYHLKDYQAAIDDYTQFISLKPNSANAADAYDNRGMIYFKLKDKQAAMNDLQKAMSLYAQQGRQDAYKKALQRLQNLQYN